MYDMKALVPRYFEMRFPNGLRLEVEPPKLKALKKIMSISNIGEGEMDEESLNGLTEGVAIALSKNKQNKDITGEFITDNMNIDQIQGLLTAYFNWVGEIQNSKN